MSQDLWFEPLMMIWKPGMSALYMPREAHGDLSHPSVEQGVVTSVNDQYVFVRFKGDTESKACYPRDLW